MAKKDGGSGYTHCACRDCFDDTISSNVRDPELCSMCEDSDCAREVDGGGECQRDDAYGVHDHADSVAMVESLLM